MTEMKRESGVVQKTLFRFVKQVASLAQKLTDAALIQLSHPAARGLPTGSMSFYSISANTWTRHSF
jgi:hypothetical protein